MVGAVVSAFLVSRQCQRRWDSRLCRANCTWANPRKHSNRRVCLEEFQFRNSDEGLGMIEPLHTKAEGRSGFLVRLSLQPPLRLSDWHL